MPNVRDWMREFHKQPADAIVLIEDSAKLNPVEVTLEHVSVETHKGGDDAMNYDAAYQAGTQFVVIRG